MLEDERLAPGCISGVYVEALAVAERGAWPCGAVDEYPADFAAPRRLRPRRPHRGGISRVSRALRADAARGRRRMSAAPEERLITTIARLIRDPAAPPARHVAVGAASPIPAAACTLVQMSGTPLRLSLIARQQRQPVHRRRARIVRPRRPGAHRPVLPRRRTDRRAGQHQHDRHRRVARAAACAFRAALAPPSCISSRRGRSCSARSIRAACWCRASTIISAPGLSPPGVFRRGHAQALVTGQMRLFVLRRAPAASRWPRCIPGETIETIREATGFDYDCPAAGAADARTDARPNSRLLRGPVCEAMLETYPDLLPPRLEPLRHRKGRLMNDTNRRSQARVRATALPLRAGALAGLKVIDLTRVLGGPYCTMILGDHGAEIIKIEPPQGDETRDWGPPFRDEDAASYFIGVNRNKRSIALDLAPARRPRGAAAPARRRRRADRKLQARRHGKVGAWL